MYQLFFWILLLIQAPSWCAEPEVVWVIPNTIVCKESSRSCSNFPRITVWACLSNGNWLYGLASRQCGGQGKPYWAYTLACYDWRRKNRLYTMCSAGASKRYVQMLMRLYLDGPSGYV